MSDLQRTMYETEARPSPETSPRTVIVHYHLFKNAGTSVDRTLRDNFGSGWTEREATGRAMTPEELRDILDANPWISVFSSHTLSLPPPTMKGIVIIPVLFVRHPLDRIRSVYDFERRQDADTPGARVAKETDIAGYIEWRLERAGANRDRSVTDFQTDRLARGSQGKTPLQRASRTVESLPFIGLVESYDLSIARLQDVLAPHFPSVRLQSSQDNTTAPISATLEERLADLRERIKDRLFDRLLEVNQDDLALWMAIRQRYRT